MLSAKAQTLYFPPNTGNSWDTISPASLGWCQDKIDTLINYLGRNNTKAFIILKDGKIVVEHYFGTFTQDSIWYWASAGKTLTAFAVGLAQQDGYLSINDKSSKYLGTGWTVCPQAKEDLITVRHQLTMTSGLDDGVVDVDCTIDTCLQYLADAGTRWAYHNAPYTLLDSVMYYATGKSLNTYVTQKIKNITGMTGAYIHAGFNNVFYSPPRSMARFGLLVLNKGVWNTDTIMSDTAYFNQMVNTSQNINLSYGYLWWLNGKASFHLPQTQFTFPGYLESHAPADMISALGKNDQILNVVPSMNLVMVRMGEPFGISLPVGPVVNDSIWVKIYDAFCTASIQKITGENMLLSVYPNPATRSFKASIPNGSFDLFITDLAGRKILELKNCTGETEINCADFPRGMYILKALTPEFVYNQKIILSSY